VDDPCDGRADGVATGVVGVVLAHDYLWNRAACLLPQFQSHVAKGSYEGEMIKITDAEAFVSGSLQNRQFTVTYKKSILSYGVSEITLNNLTSVRDEVYSGFRAVAQMLSQTRRRGLR
jgi:hypothetical protein